VATETEIKLSLPPRAAHLLAALPLLAGSAPLRQKLLNTYYDTPDLRLLRERVAVRFRKKGGEWLLTVKCAAPSIGGLARRDEWEVAASPGDFDFSHVGDRKLRHRLESLRDDLAAAFTTDFTRTAWLLETPPGARIELALDRGRIEAGSRKEAVCEIELELLEGGASALFDLAGRLQAALGEKYALRPEPASKAERGYRLLAGTPPEAARSSPVAPHREMSAPAAFRAVALSCVTHLQGNEQGVRESDDAEFAHQARVAIRRLRSAIRAWKPVLPAAFVASFDPRWKTLAGTMGDTRNWDVFSGETLPALTGAHRGGSSSNPGNSDSPGNAGFDRLARHALKRRADSRKIVRAALLGVAYSRLLLEFTAAVLALPDGPGQAIKPFARRCLDKRARKVARLAAGARDGGAASRHRLRVALKRLRYALEFFAPLFPGRRQRSYHLAVTQLQDLLGRLNDLVVAGRLIGETPFRREAGWFDAWVTERSAPLLDELAPALDSFTRQKTPWKKHR